ncbi:hypothetical protein B5X24_HaOG211716 [Helicoverpa armigera]|nr:hypothetical protein B5X24_HaOG211716 [Helicoverpa armigera]
MMLLRNISLGKNHENVFLQNSNFIALEAVIQVVIRFTPVILAEMVNREIDQMKLCVTKQLLVCQGHATIVAVSPLFEEWLGWSHGALTYRMTQVLTGHGCFGRYLHRIGPEEAPGCHHCADSLEDTVDHTVQECLAWEGHRRVLVEALGGGDLSRPALVQAMVRGEREWDAVASFCEAVMLEKEEAERQSSHLSSRPPRWTR